MDSIYFQPGYPFRYDRFFNAEPDLQERFLSLPEDAQQAILSRGIDSAEDLQRALHEYQLKD
ncbi:MAG: hypothetical protein SOH45_02115 [Oscillospiraceae bacterium]